MNTILERFIDLREVLKSFGGLEKEYNWLVTDLDWSYPDCYLDYFQDYRIFEDSSDRLNNYWITGEKLTQLADHQNVYFIWGVFSAFHKDTRLDLDTINVEPYADGNPGFWVPNPEIQHKDAVFELVFWDSTLILLLSKNDDISNKFRAYFKDWKDLNSYNQSNII